MVEAPCLAALPETLARLLLVGGRGPGLTAARDAAVAAGPTLSALADALALAVWEEAPFWPEAAAVLQTRLSGRRVLPPPLATLVGHIAAFAGQATPEPYFDRLAARRDVGRMLTYLLERHRKAPEDPGLLHRLCALAPMAGDAAARQAVGTALSEMAGPLAPFGALAAGELALLDGEVETAASLLRRTGVGGTSPAVGLRLAEALLRQSGESEAAISLLAAAVAQRPWDSLALARLHDVATGLAERTTPLSGGLAVLVYSWNNAALLEPTLAALAATDWDGAAGPVRLVVCDNGSSDATAAVLSAWQDQLGERLAVVTLPVNIGAPAARNWLAALPEVRAAAYVAYLDDDALVPPDWLGRLGAAVAALPQAGVWGAMIRGGSAPRFVQSADTHLLPLARSAGDWGRGFSLARPWLATADFGQYAVCRPCASVTGCCHLFRGEVLAGLGGFDIRFSPSQYDDLDMDVRQLLAGRPAVCQGHLRVTHAKATGAASAPGGRQYGSGFANQFKLHHKYDAVQFAMAARTAFDALAADCAAKALALVDLGLVAEKIATFWAVRDGHDR